MKFKHYQEALEFAQNRANETGLDNGIRVVSSYGGKRQFVVCFLPAPEKSFGSDMGAERVTPCV